MAQDADTPVELFATPSEFEASTIAAALRDQGIRATVFGGNLAGMRAKTVAMAQVMVRRGDLERAREVLRAVKAESVDIDWDAEFEHEPEAKVTENHEIWLAPRVQGMGRTGMVVFGILCAAGLALMLWAAWTVGTVRGVTVLGLTLLLVLVPVAIFHGLRRVSKRRNW
jgi:hypothetical protein